ncbi:MAG TPA: sulfite exporter TauE/SafE family protein [Candidatus Nanopelagicales bacterium]|nr:sulfite exporter TauE/SafE family protein [Candidatus Nanopelagicales bacterium]
MIVGLLLAAGGFGAGIFGSLLGLGGGILIVPLLTVGFGVPFREAVGVSLVCVIVTSSAAAGVFLERHTANLRLGMLLEVFTASGALLGGLVAFLLPERVLAGLFAALLAYTALSMLRRGRAQVASPSLPAGVDGPGAAHDAGPDTRAPRRSLADEVAGPGYLPRRLGAGAGGSVGAGVMSALLGVGGGIVKVPLMHLVMGVPLKVATATSNLMIGVTAAASAIVYLLRGGIDPYIAGPTAVGVFAGAMVGSRLAARIDVRILRLLFVGVLALTAAQMALRALG